MDIRLVDLTQDSDEEEGEIVSQTKIEQELDNDLKMELLRRNELVLQLNSENFDFKCKVHSLEAQLNFVMDENRKLRKEIDKSQTKALIIPKKDSLKDEREVTSTFEHSTTHANPPAANESTQMSEDDDWDTNEPKKNDKLPTIATVTSIPTSMQLPLKYIIEKIFKYVEVNEVQKYFEAFGQLKTVTMREVGIEKYKADYSSAFIEFKSLNCNNFLTLDHQFRNQSVEVREFVPGDRTTEDDDWDEEFTGSHRSKPAFFRKNRQEADESFESRRSISRSSSKVPPSKRFRSQASKEDAPATRTIMIRGKFTTSEKDDLKEYFSNKFSPVIKMSTVPQGTKLSLLFIKFDNYESAEEALSESSHRIGYKAYECRPAKDF